MWFFYAGFSQQLSICVTAQCMFFMVYVAHYTHRRALWMHALYTKLLRRIENMFHIMYSAISSFTWSGADARVENIKDNKLLLTGRAATSAQIAAPRRGYTFSGVLLLGVHWSGFLSLLLEAGANWSGRKSAFYYSIRKHVIGNVLYVTNLHARVKRYKLLHFWSRHRPTTGGNSACDIINHVREQIQGVETRDTKKSSSCEKAKAVKQACKKVSISCTWIVISNAIPERREYWLWHH